MILSQSLQQLADGHAAEAVLTELTRKLTQTLTHAPSKLLRETASEQPVETVNFVAQQLTHAFRKDKCPYLTHNNTLLDDEPASPSFDNQ